MRMKCSKTRARLLDNKVKYGTRRMHDIRHTMRLVAGGHLTQPNGDRAIRLLQAFVV